MVAVVAGAVPAKTSLQDDLTVQKRIYSETLDMYARMSEFPRTHRTERPTSSGERSVTFEHEESIFRRTLFKERGHWLYLLLILSIWLLFFVGVQVLFNFCS
jgi:hypothetical protein